CDALHVSPASPPRTVSPRCARQLKLPSFAAAARALLHTLRRSYAAKREAVRGARHATHDWFTARGGEALLRWIHERAPPYSVHRPAPLWQRERVAAWRADSARAQGSACAGPRT